MSIWNFISIAFSKFYKGLRRRLTVLSARDDMIGFSSERTSGNQNVMNILTKHLLSKRAAAKTLARTLDGQASWSWSHASRRMHFTYRKPDRRYGRCWSVDEALFTLDRIWSPSLSSLASTCFSDAPQIRSIESWYNRRFTCMIWG